MEFSLYTITIGGFFKREIKIFQDNVLVYTASKASFFSTGKYIVYDTNGAEHFRVSKFSLFKSNFHFLKNGRIKGIILSKSFSNLYNCEYDSGIFTMKSNFLQREYTIFQDEDEVAKVSRNSGFTSDEYGIAIQTNLDQEEILSMVLAVLIVNEIRRSSS